ncbi:hypothetical protein GCM10008107_06530 [Psychrosphaera saromensis]|uniref:Haem-binding uptake Tiki superfamily ChaN domain-containing protein n=1 Tax=Psychrosphaera saromensis TaxID=716813 RepID=A0A2S7UYS7_9GAMM|nr:hypothetical protein [Psychrosphaera saromensis]PQJ54431.1 hypothetical protein BTO11_12740 [Psychrosphaera saromensis]GHB60003.1 hypothetical protein GCM10008107_06530 [Psychrosphaera saromensis]GLQ14374.1 hypothetical protein GCM10007917_18290 [Psychrosphaera saromensis]
MKKIILFCLLASNSAFSSEHDNEKFLLEAVRIGNQIQEQTKGKSLVEKLQLIESFSKDFTNNPLALDIIMQDLGVQYSFAGLHRKALIAKDTNVKSEKLVSENLTTYKAKDAISEILKRSQVYQVVMFNEAHDIAQHRVLTYRMLSGLWEQGYRYFAAESLNSLASLQIKKGYVTNPIGYYTRESTYANLVLKAKDIGFKIVSYDLHKPKKLNTIEERETSSALTIKEKVFDKDPNAKIVIHVGYSHINEEDWLASKLKSIIGLETLTIDQTTRIERSNTEYEHPTYTKAVKSVELLEPFVFVKDNEVWSSDSNKWDISVFWPRTKYFNGRPKWASLGRMNYSVSTNDCKKSYPCMVDVFKFKHKDEVPLDRVVISSEKEHKSVFLSQGSNIIVMTDSNGEQINKIMIQN